MSFNLLLDSSLAKQQRNKHNQKSHDFTIYFNPPIVVDREKKLQSGVEQTDHHELLLVQHCGSLRKQQNQVAKEHRRLANFDVS